MTQQDKDLLLCDLSARLPYGVNVKCYSVEEPYGSEPIKLTPYLLYDRWEHILDFKPYLRPMSSMTEEESIEYGKTLTCHIGRDNCTYTHQTFKSYDWLNAHHFDYRGLIPKGLALEAPKGMYDILK